jgi:hypothetical protein
MDTSTTLTARLARAAGANSVEPAVDQASDSAEDGRCAASVISGQRCQRPVAEGQTLCAAHLAMGTKTPAMARSTLA